MSKMQAPELYEPPKLVSIPREIRGQVYALVLQSEQSAVAPESAQIVDPCTTDATFGWLLYPDCAQPKTAGWGLLGCNRQLRNEVHENLGLQSFQEKASRYRLACDIQRTPADAWALPFPPHRGRHINLFTEWTVFPAPPKYMRAVVIDLRLRYMDIDFLFRSIHQLLNRLIHHGPRFFYEGPLDYQIKLSSLRVNIECTSSVDTGALLKGLRHLSALPIRSVSNLTVRVDGSVYEIDGQDPALATTSETL